MAEHINEHSLGIVRIFEILFSKVIKMKGNSNFHAIKTIKSFKLKPLNFNSIKPLMFDNKLQLKCLASCLLCPVL